MADDPPSIAILKEGNAESYKKRSNLDWGNANTFNTTFNNPFLVTTYNQQNLGSYATVNSITDISSIISSLIGGLSSLIDVSTFTLRISTIEAVQSDPNRTVTINASTLRLNAGYSLDFNGLRACCGPLSRDKGQNLCARGEGLFHAFFTAFFFAGAFLAAAFFAGAFLAGLAEG